MTPARCSPSDPRNHTQGSRPAVFEGCQWRPPQHHRHAVMEPWWVSRWAGKAPPTNLGQGHCLSSKLVAPPRHWSSSKTAPEQACPERGRLPDEHERNWPYTFLLQISLQTIRACDHNLVLQSRQFFATKLLFFCINYYYSYLSSSPSCTRKETNQDRIRKQSSYFIIPLKNGLITPIPRPMHSSIETAISS